jgi:ADP-heptose:LPS heptosyltransferase
MLEPLALVPGVCLHAFQRGPALENAPSWLQNVAGSDDVLEAARILKAMDLLLTVDSMPAHLGGATGVKTWLLLHSDADWRWMTGRQDSPWYPGMRLFRQQRAGDWRSVIHNVATELQAMTSHSASV